MLEELRVTDLGIVEEITLTFGPGLTAISGETGAGKTLLVEALQLLLGGRADPVLVRDGAPEARVEGRFVDEDGEEHVLARVLPADGRSRAYVDGRLVTAGQLAELGATFLDLHGQHAHQQLLSGAAQRDALDQFAGEEAERARREIREARAEARTWRAELEALGGDERARAREADLLRFQIDEIDAARVDDPGEDDALRAEEALLADATALREALATAYAALAEGGLDALGAAAAAVADRPPLADLHERLRGLQAELAELGRDLRFRAEGVVDDPVRLEAVRARRQALRQLRRKYGETLADVLEYRRRIGDRLAQLEHHEEHAARVADAIARAEQRAQAAAKRLRRARQRAAASLGEAVDAHLHDLAMPRARLVVTLEPSVLTDDGGDAVTFLLAANPGEPARPLARAASGGELARTMLALRLVCRASAPTLVFDEVDAGIGGEAGTAVGRLLAVLASSHQVLCVTHLAQVAAFADRQIVVTKREHAGRTVAHAQEVVGDGRVRELSRMLAGVGESDHARRHAAELLAAASAADARAAKRVRAERH